MFFFFFWAERGGSLFSPNPHVGPVALCHVYMVLCKKFFGSNQRMTMHTSLPLSQGPAYYAIRSLYGMCKQVCVKKKKKNLQFQPKDGVVTLHKSINRPAYCDPRRSTKASHYKVAVTIKSILIPSDVLHLIEPCQAYSG